MFKRNIIFTMLRSRSVPGRIVGCISQSLSTSAIALDSSNHYKSLGVPRGATQAEIKEAYYNQSKLYHPDVNSEKGASNKFREINEAYEVLGNVTSKKLYDKGIEYTYPGSETPEERFHRSRSKRTVVPYGGRQAIIYDFDAWTKHHYENTLKKEKYKKERKIMVNEFEKNANDIESIQILSLTIILSVVAFGCFLFENPMDEVKDISKDKK